MELRKKKCVRYAEEVPEEDWQRLERETLERHWKKHDARKKFKFADIVPLYKFFFPCKAFRIAGDFCSPDIGVTNEYHGFSTINYFKSVNHTSFDDSSQLLSVYLNPISLSQYRFPWRYIVERFQSVNDANMKLIGDLTEQYCQLFEERFKSLLTEKKRPQPLKDTAIAIEEADPPLIISLPLSDTSVPTLWSRRRRSSLSIMKDTMQDLLVINMPLIKLLGFTPNEMLEWVLRKGVHPIFDRGDHFQISARILEISLRWLRDTSSASEPAIYRTSLQTKDEKELPVEVAQSVHVTPDWMIMVYQFTDLRKQL
eukprot:TRINITY_DN9681_c0_g2_i1.p1 TRINITY_DN9681_c0_g2~~TRINITY_DN9681_c0_g2_i1.p1  ORF type:complete len:313 (+),score=12.64 TRINITY_DN9681_c0_g2_i1:137-1075(+)